MFVFLFRHLYDYLCVTAGVIIQFLSKLDTYSWMCVCDSMTKDDPVRLEELESSSGAQVESKLLT